MAATFPRRAPRRPPKGFSGFLHLLARFYMNYWHAIDVAAKRRGHRRAVDIDIQPSKEGTLWGLHWPTVGKNKLHDPEGKIGPHRRIDDLTDAEIGRLKGPKGQRPHEFEKLLYHAGKSNVRVEGELKQPVEVSALMILSATPWVKKMIHSGQFQIKTLAVHNTCVEMLTEAHYAHIPTMLSFTHYRGRGISATKAFPVTDYVRGKGKWVA